jgi:hypothetical protein
MKVYKTLGSKQTLLDRSQAILMSVFFFIGAIFENIYFLLICPAIIFSVTFIIRERYFGGKPEWGVYAVRMIRGEKIYYARQLKDRLDIEK